MQSVAMLGLGLSQQQVKLVVIMVMALLSLFLLKKQKRQNRKLNMILNGNKSQINKKLLKYQNQQKNDQSLKEHQDSNQELIEVQSNIQLFQNQLKQNENQQQKKKNVQEEVKLFQNLQKQKEDNDDDQDSYFEYSTNRISRHFLKRKRNKINIQKYSSSHLKQINELKSKNEKKGFFTDPLLFQQIFDQKKKQIPKDKIQVKQKQRQIHDIFTAENIKKIKQNIKQKLQKINENQLTNKIKEENQIQFEFIRNPLSYQYQQSIQQEKIQEEKNLDYDFNLTERQNFVLHKAKKLLSTKLMTNQQCFKKYCPLLLIKKEQQNLQSLINMSKESKEERQEQVKQLISVKESKEQNKIEQEKDQTLIEDENIIKQLNQINMNQSKNSQQNNYNAKQKRIKMVSKRIKLRKNNVIKGSKYELQKRKLMEKLQVLAMKNLFEKINSKQFKTKQKMIKKLKKEQKTKHQ